MSELDDKIKKIEDAISDVKKTNEKKMKLLKLQQEYYNLTYQEKYPFKYKIKRIFKTLKKESSCLMESANKKKLNPWD